MTPNRPHGKITQIDAQFKAWRNFLFVPGKYDINVYRHGSFALSIAVNGIPNYFGLLMEIRYDKESTGASLLTLAQGSQIKWVGNEITIALTKEVIESLPTNPNPATPTVLKYDLITVENANYNRILEGDFIVNPGVSRA